MDGGSHESVYNKFIVFEGEAMKYGVIERVICSTLRWFDHRENATVK